MANRRKRPGLSVSACCWFGLAVVAFVTAGGAGAKQQGCSALPRGQTLYTTGTMWGPYSDLNPFKNWDYVTGTVGLVYETPVPLRPAQGQVHPVAGDEGNAGRRRTSMSMTRSARRQVE